MVDKAQRLSLLEELYRNSRVRASHLEETLHLSRQTISKIRGNLWNKHIIDRPTFIINPLVLNLQYFFMEIKTNPSEPKILEQIKIIRELASIDGVLGEYSLIAKFEVQTKKNFAEILSQIDENVSQSLFSSYRIIECIDIFKVGGFVLDRTHPTKQLDDKEKKWHLLQLLQKNYNLKRWPERTDESFFTASEKVLLEKINLSREFNRFQLVDHIIQDFTITLNNEKLQALITGGERTYKEPDFSTKFYLQIQPKQMGQYTTLAKELVHEPNIIDLYRTGNEAGLLAIVRTKGLKGLNEFLKHLYKTYPIMNTHTTVVVEEIKPAIYPPTLNIAREICQ